MNISLSYWHPASFLRSVYLPICLSFSFNSSLSLSFSLSFHFHHILFFVTTMSTSVTIPQSTDGPISTTILSRHPHPSHAYSFPFHHLHNGREKERGGRTGGRRGAGEGVFLGGWGRRLVIKRSSPKGRREARLRWLQLQFSPTTPASPVVTSLTSERREERNHRRWKFLNLRESIGTNMERCSAYVGVCSIFH